MVDIVWDLWLVLCRWLKKQGLTGGYQILANKYVFGKTSGVPVCYNHFPTEKTVSSLCTNHDAAEKYLAFIF